MTLRFLLLGLALHALWGCGDENPVVARVGDNQITAAELLAYEARLPEALRLETQGVEAHRAYLQDIIDKELLLLEARERGVYERPDVRSRLARTRRERVLAEYTRREVYDRITVTDEELREHQVATGRDRAVKVRRVVVATAEEAAQIIDALRAGAEFDSLAEKTLLSTTWLDGGHYLIRDNLRPPVLQQAVFPLAPGEISEPVYYASQYGVYQVVDESPVGWESVRKLLLEEIYKGKVPPALHALVTRLREECQLVRHDEAFGRLAERLARGGPLSAADRGDVLYEYRGGAFTAGELLDHAHEIDIGFGDDAAARIDWFAMTVIEPRILMLEGARALGIPEEPAMVEYFARREESLALEEMRREAVSGVLVEDSEARQFYQQQPVFFRPLEEIIVQEVLVASEEEALEMRQRIADGQDIGPLAEEHSLRLQTKGREGVFHIHPFQESRFGVFLDAARGLAEGALVGPLAVTVPREEILNADPMRAGERYYSVFRLLSSTIGAGPEPFAKVARRARALVRKVKQDEAFHRFLLDLRYRNEKRIEVYADRLADLPG